MILKLGFDLGKRVELWGFEPQTSCMPYKGTTSTAVHLCRSASHDVRCSPPESRPVAVLSCCTVPSLHPCELSGLSARETHAGHSTRLYLPAAEIAVANGPNNAADITEEGFSGFGPVLAHIWRIGTALYVRVGAGLRVQIAWSGVLADASPPRLASIAIVECPR